MKTWQKYVGGGSVLAAGVIGAGVYGNHALNTIVPQGIAEKIEAQLERAKTLTGEAPFVEKGHVAVERDPRGFLAYKVSLPALSQKQESEVGVVEANIKPFEFTLWPAQNNVKTLASLITTGAPGPMVITALRPVEFNAGVTVGGDLDPPLFIRKTSVATLVTLNGACEITGAHMILDRAASSYSIGTKCAGIEITAPGQKLAATIDLTAGFDHKELGGGAYQDAHNVELSQIVLDTTDEKAVITGKVAAHVVFGKSSKISSGETDDARENALAAAEQNMNDLLGPGQPDNSTPHYGMVSVSFENPHTEVTQHGEHVSTVTDLSGVSAFTRLAFGQMNSNNADIEFSANFFDRDGKIASPGDGAACDANLGQIPARILAEHEEVFHDGLHALPGSAEYSRAFLYAGAALQAANAAGLSAQFDCQAHSGQADLSIKGNHALTDSIPAGEGGFKLTGNLGDLVGRGKLLEPLSGVVASFAALAKNTDDGISLDYSVGKDGAMTVNDRQIGKIPSIKLEP